VKTDLEQRLHLTPSPAGSLARVRAAALAELQATHSPQRWQGDVGMLLGATLLLTAAAVLATGLSGSWGAALAAQRSTTLVLLVLAQIAGAAAALSPRAQRAQFVALLLGALAMAALVLLRGAGGPSTVPQWVCSASHFGLSLGPIALALFLLRRSHPTNLKALSAGVAAGTIGALLGELACGRDAHHVALFHLPAFAAAVLLTLVLARRLRPLSFAD